MRLESGGNLIVCHTYSPAHLEALSKINCVVVHEWRHRLLKSGELLEVTGGHRGVFVKEITREDFERRVNDSGWLEWLDAPDDAHFWEVLFD